MRRALVVAGIGLVALLLAGSARAQDRGEVHGSLRVFVQPVTPDWLLVFTPTVTGKVAALRWLTFDVNWAADVVTGATPRTYGLPDVVTAATPFTEVRNVFGAGAGATIGPATITAGYAYGTENDYRSQLLRFGLTLDLANHNSIITADYSHSFDSICDLDQPNVPVLLRQPLDTSRGCFAGTRGLTEESLGVDNVEVAYTQTITRALLGSVTGSYQHLSGFQSNPYRRVRLSGGLFQAQESHPLVRDRGAITFRGRYAVAPFAATIGGDLRLYADTWGIQSLTSELFWDAPFHKSRPAWRYVARLRGYAQSGAVFYRDAGNPNSYDRTGPVGSFFTADQELAPLTDLLLGARFVHTSAHSVERRTWKMFTNVEWALSFDYVKLFALTPEPPNAPRMRGWVSALVAAVAVTGKF